ncbi:4-hydroxy-tetrahydrodipicolinate reductase [Salinibaculum salinum]|uniref:4-hydroxy-tetrahydrodipicolinate reductase n=1 Tax=Salinibaculum salinum TaxID=3131996 RepID=UPI0030EBFA2F
MTRLAINGAAGRMGQTVIETASDRDDVSVVFGIDVDTDADIDVPLSAPDETANALAEHDPDAVIDFTVPDSTVALAEACADAGVALVVGTTGVDEEQLSVLQEASEAVPLLKATNFSRGIQGLLRALGPALEALDGYDVEVMETHHNQKQDAPSGTAKTILDEISEHRDFETVAGREGIQPREEGEVGMLVRRAGDIRGEHEVMLADNDEVLTISHRAEDRAVFAAGAIDAAVWLAEQDAGWYGFDDVVDDS